MPRLLLVLLVLTAVAAPAAAQPRSVRVTSTPSGAMVYVGDKEQGPVGVTPIMLKLAPGEHGLIIELEGYTSAVQQVKVPKGKGPAIDVAVTLLPAIGVLYISGDAALGATVTIDDAERGKVPLRVELEAGAHHIQVASDPPYEEFVEIKAGDDRTLLVTAEPPPPPPPPPADPGPARGTPIVSAHVGTELGWRTFAYEGPDSPNTQTFTSGMVAAVRIEVEAAPWRLDRRARRLWPLALVVGGSYAPIKAATIPGDDGVADLYWRTMDIGLRYRLGLMRGRLAIGFDAGWMRNLYQFRARTDVLLEAKLPDVDYQMVRLGVRVEGKRGPLTGWFGLDNRIIVGTGVVADRYLTSEVGGFALRLGGLARLWQGRIEVGAEYGLQRYGWELEPFPPPNPNRPTEHPATGATDTFHGLQLWVGSHY